MRLTATFAVLQLLLLNSASVAAFAAPRIHASAPVTRLNAVDPIVAAYQKKTAFQDITATLPKPEEVIPAAPAVNIAVPDSITSSIDDAASQAAAAASQAQAAADQAARAASDIKTQAQAGFAAVQAKAAASAKATAAANAAAAKAVAATKAERAAAATAAAASAAAAAAPMGDGPKVPTLVQFLKVAPKPEDVVYAPPAGKSLSDVGAGFGRLGSNLFGEDGAKVLSSGVSGATKAAQSISSGDGLPSVEFDPAALKGAVVGAGAAASTIDPAELQRNVQNFAANLRFDEYGAWYATAAALVFAVTQRQAGKDEARTLYEKELALAQARADEAAAAAGVAAQGAALAKNMAAQVQKKTGTMSSSDMMLESSKLREMEAERELMRTQLSKVTSETVKLRSMLDELIAARDTTAETVFVEPDTIDFATETDQIPITYMTMERDPDEDARILAVIKELDDENVKVSASAPAKAKKTTRKKAAPKSTKKSAKMSAAATAAAALDEAAKPAKKTARKRAVKTAKRVKRAVASKRAKAAPKKVKTVAEAAEEIKVETVQKKKAPKNVETVAEAAEEIKVETVPKKKAPKKTEVVMGENPWGSLSDSTLKRKTVAQLTAYLAERSVAVPDDSGKAPKKAVLVSAVRGL